MYFEFEYEVHAYARRSIEAHSKEEAWEKFSDEIEDAIDEAREDMEVVSDTIRLVEVI